MPLTQKVYGNRHTDLEIITEWSTFLNQLTDFERRFAPFKVTPKSIKI